eukprot:TRINITY_DN20158_c0_g1_i1.p1 TRINITY_DN20158_c0_g1~~TRINITY_DN20158_c0_g1_i1.p1  ORF type:complete len:183 (-),score=37.09 TRINITY_DN20158_c0_g1_i1:367-915(-)
MATSLSLLPGSTKLGCSGSSFVGRGLHGSSAQTQPGLKARPLSRALPVTSSLVSGKGMALRQVAPSKSSVQEHSERFDDVVCMAKKAMIERDVKREKLVKKHLAKREELKEKIKESETMEEKFALQRQLQQLPRNSAPCRVQRRCFVTGRPRAVYRDFGLSRHCLREMAHACLLPGVTKSSW